jgi:Asp-tRNA(Asn)/Glu-tRNA(Gln) amidotransferase A subunit family amidase
MEELRPTLELDRKATIDAHEAVRRFVAEHLGTRVAPLVIKDETVHEPTLEEAIRRIEARDGSLHAFVSTRLDRATREAAAMDEAAASSPLHRVPYSLKDTWDVAGEITTGGSHRYRDRVPVVDSPVHASFKEAGAVLVGKTNLSDLMIFPESSSYVGGVARNPNDLSRTPGGSSGGAAAAVADGMVAFDWGSDVGGSIRMPAAYCGVLGMRLSSETWPMVGDFPRLPQSLRWMNGQGPITATVSRMRDVLAAATSRLRTGTARSFTLKGAMFYGPDARGRGQWPTFREDVSPPLRAALEGGELREDHGLLEPAAAHRVALAMWCSHFEDLLSSDTLTLSEGLGAVASSLLFRGRFGDRRLHPHTAGILLLIVIGRLAVFRDAPRAERAAALFRESVGELWDRGYLLVAPTVAWPAPKHGGSFFNARLQQYAMPGNLADATALALPFGRFPGGMPRSLQIMGPPGSEAIVLEVGERLMRAHAGGTR